MTKKELEDLKIGDMVRLSNYEFLKVKTIKIIGEQDKEFVELVCQAPNGTIRSGTYKKFIIPKKFVKIDKGSGEITTILFEDILKEDGLYSYSMSRSIKEALYNGEKVYSPNAIFTLS